MSFETVVYRAAGFETPLWSFPNLSDGRYNRAGGVPTQYLSMHPMTPWAELLRNFGYSTATEAREMRLEIWAIRLELADDPHIVSFDTASDFGLSPDELVADDYGPCQSAAAAMHTGGIRSFLAPSAALAGTVNLVVIAPAVVIDYHSEPLDEVDWPTGMLAQDGRCPERLWNHVHFRRVTTEHPGLAAWRAGTEYVFEQPEVTAASLAAA